MLALWVPMAALSFLFLLWLIKNPKSNSQLPPPPPGPHGLPIVGYLPFLGSNLHKLFMDLAHVYGPIYKLSIGQRLCVVIGSPSLAKQVVRDHDITFANRNPTIAAAAFSYGGNDIAFQSYGSDWRMLRKIFVQKMQSKANLDSFYSLRKNEVKSAITDVHRKIGKPINVGELAYMTVINMISGMFWGGTLEGERKKSVAAMFRVAAAELVETLGRPNVSDFFPVIARFDVQGVERKMKKVTARLERIYDMVIDQRKMKEGKNGERKDFLDFLLEFKDDETGSSISPQQIKALLMDIVIGGTDTTSTTVEWALAELMLHPQVMTRCQAELSQVVGLNNVVEEFHIPELTYLQAVAKETLRLHPVAPLLLPRSPSKPCKVGGYTIPRGTKVFLNVWAMHRDPDFWDHPFEFQPERFSSDSSKLDYFGNHFHYLPFGSGRRICAGLPLGERMLMYVLATFLHMFKWELPNGESLDTSEKLGVVLKKSDPLVAIPTPRLSSLDLYAGCSRA